MVFKLIKSLAEVPLAPVFCILGKDDFLREKAWTLLRDRVLDENLRELNYALFQAGEDDFFKIIETCQDYPCFAEKRVVVVTHLHQMKKKESECLIGYLKNPQPTTLLLLESEGMDGRLDWVKQLKKLAEIIDIPEVKQVEAISWVQKCFEREAKTWEKEVPETLVELIGLNFRSLQNVVQQLCLYVGEKSEICLVDLEALLVKLSEENAFEVVEALFKRDDLYLDKALNRLLEAGEAPLKILSLLFRNLGILLEIRFGSKQSKPQFPLPSWIREKYVSQVRRVQNKLNYGLMQPLAKADQLMKSSGLDSKLILKNCVEELKARL